MAKVITFSRVFPSYHPRKGEPTYFVEKIFNALVRLKLPIQSTGLDYEAELSNIEKYHTIRSGNRWKAGDKFSPRIWSGKPYQSKMITIAPDIEIKRVWSFEIKDGLFFINGELYAYNSSTELLNTLAMNDGLYQSELLAWFNYPKPFSGQIICWNDKIEY